MATYKSKKSIGTLNASVNLSYGGKSIVKALTREYDEVYDIRKTIGTGITQLVAFNTSTTFLYGSCRLINIASPLASVFVPLTAIH